MPVPSIHKARFAWCLYDWANSAFATTVLAAVFPVYFLTLVPTGGIRLTLPGFVTTIPAPALWGYVVSASMVLVAVSAPYLGALADRAGWRRRFLIVLGTAGAAATALLSLAGPGDYLAAALLFAAANVGFAGGNVFYNAFLPELAAGETLDRLSARGFAYGYLGGGLELLLVFGLIQGFAWFGFADRGEATRCALLITGLWWGLFSLPAFLYLKEPPRRLTGTVKKGFASYLATFGEIRRHKDLLLFLAAFLCYNDGIQTIIVVSAVFAKEELGLSQGAILGCFLMIQFLAMPGTLGFGRLAERIGAKRSILLSLLLFIAVTGYAWFITQPWQFWVLAAVVALIYGGSQALSRSLFGALIPADKTAEFFGFYAISAKFASIFGPLLFALISHLTGSTRLSILALALFFASGAVLLALVDVEGGKRSVQGFEP